MTMDKIFVFALVVFFIGFVIYCAWNSKQNEKKQQMTAPPPSGPGQASDEPPRPRKMAKPRRPEKEHTHV